MATATLDLPDGASLAVTVEGHGPDLMLVSGLGGTAGFWSPLVPALAASHRVVRFDARGIGASTRGTAAVDIDRLARDCIAVVDGLGMERPILVGHSTGGAIGQALAGLAPGRLGGLALGGTWLRPNRYMTALFEARRRILDLDPAAYAALGALLGHAPDWLGDNWSAYEDATARPPLSEDARRVVRERIDALLAFDGSAHAGALALPTLVLGAQDDAIVPAFLQRELAAALPSPAFVMFPDGGHFFPITRPDAFLLEVIGFARAVANGDRGGPG